MKNHKMQTPALLGGTPVRETVFSSRPHITGAEEKALRDCLRGGFFSRFIGSPTAHVRRELRMTSEQVMGLREFWSFMGGPNVRRFEGLWARAHKVPFSISVNSATSGLTTALLASGVQPGDEVVTTPFSFTATASSIVAAQAVPVFADVDIDTFCLDVESVKAKITGRTSAFMPVHILGNAGDIIPLLSLAKKKGLSVVEDSAQAPGGWHRGKALGTFSDAGVFSFQETKNVMTGEGGMIVTRRPDIAEKCRLIRNHGESVPVRGDAVSFLENAVGYNFRMTELTAALGWAQTQKLTFLNGFRRKNWLYLCRRLNEAGQGFLRSQRVTNVDTFSPYCAGYRWDTDASGLHRDVVAAALRAEGIPVATGYPRLMSENALFTRKIAFGRKGWPFRPAHAYGDGRKAWPNAARLQYREYLGFFQMGWPNTEGDMEDIALAFEKILAHRGRLIRESRRLHRPRAGFVSGRR